MNFTAFDSCTETLAALRFQLDMGVDEAVGDLPERLGIAKALPPAPPIPLPVPTPAASHARVDLNSIETLEGLRNALAGLSGLSVKDTAMSLVFGEGALNPPVMLVGEAPGEEEDRTGRPFVGPAGQLLDKMLAAIGFAREEVYITNVLNWRPPGNRTPKPDEVATCLPYLMRHVELVKPKSLLLLGGPAAKALLGRDESVTKMRGQWWSYHSAGLEAEVPTLVTYHPAYLLRSPGQKKESWRDLRLLKKKISSV